MSTIEILHDRNPDFACDVRVWVDGVELHDFVVVDVDPGAGWTREMWDESTQDLTEATEMSESFKTAALEAREGASESTYIDG